MERLDSDVFCRVSVTSVLHQSEPKQPNIPTYGLTGPVKWCHSHSYKAVVATDWPAFVFKQCHQMASSESKTLLGETKEMKV